MTSIQDTVGGGRCRVTIVTVTLGRPCLESACRSVDRQTFSDWHHYVLGDGVAPAEYQHPHRSTLGFSLSKGAMEPALNMPAGTPNPLLRWAIKHLDLGEYLCFLDDDNMYLPTFVERMVFALESMPHVGIVLCPVENRRGNWQDIDGYPEYRRCDNSAFIVRSSLAKEIGFPPASPKEECVQDYEFIKIAAERFGWTRIDERLTVFGIADNPPPLRGHIRIVDSWSLPLRGADFVKGGEVDRGIECLQQAVDYDPLDAWAYWHLAEAFMVQNAGDAARGAIERFAELIDRLGVLPDDCSMYKHAVALFVLGRREQARTRINEAIAAAQQNNFNEKLLQVENELNLGLYGVLACDLALVSCHMRRAARLVGDQHVLRGAKWKGQILRAAIKLVGRETEHRDAFELFFFALQDYSASHSAGVEGVLDSSVSDS
jgi:tetratricopeptide (TPR) repeat protein